MSDPTEEDIESAAFDAANDAYDYFEEFMVGWDELKKGKFKNDLFAAIYNVTDGLFT